MPHLPTPSNRPSRRRFLQSAAGIAAAPLFVPAAALGRSRTAPSERIRVGVVGLGSRGFNLLDAFLKESDAQVVAVCDVDELHYRDREWGTGKAYGRTPARQAVEKHYADLAGTGGFRELQVLSDFRELCGRDDVDAVVVATPDHWHALCTLEALAHGKDVYCEKPVTHLFAEGHAVYREVARREAVFQTGSQQRSDPEFRQALEILLNGHLGDIERIEVGLPPGYDRPQGESVVRQPPDHLDYEMWCGPAPRLPYMRARHHRWWRGHRAFGGGVLMDWIGHHNDIAHWSLGLDKSGPVRVEAVGWEFPETDVYDTPWHYTIRCEYKGGVTSTISDQNALGTKWFGSNGWLYVRRGKIEASDRRWLDPKFEPGSKRVFQSPGHVRNFLDCVRSRETCVAPAETAHRSITPGHLGYVSQAAGRPLQWDPQQERIVGDDEAQRLLLTVDYRAPWTWNRG